MYYLKVLGLMLFTALLCSCAKLDRVTENLSTPVTTPTVVKKMEKLNSLGYASISAQKGDSFDLQMLNAIKVSKIEAYKEMAEQLYGVLVSADNKIDSGRVQDDLLKSRVRGLVRGAKVLKSYHQGDVYITELELDLQSTPFF